MTHRTLTAIVVPALACGLAIGCSGSPSAPAPRPIFPPAPSLAIPGTTLLGVSLSGVVSDANGRQPIEGVSVSCELCGRSGHTRVITDATGSYRFSGDLAHNGGVWVRPGVANIVFVGKEGYLDPPGTDYAALDEIDPLIDPAGGRVVMIDGDTRFDMQLARR